MVIDQFNVIVDIYIVLSKYLQNLSGRQFCMSTIGYILNCLSNILAHFGRQNITEVVFQ